MDWTNLVESYKGKWVALKGDEKTVVAVAGSAKSALAKASSKGMQNPIIYKVPRSITTYAGSNSDNKFQV